VKFIDCAECGAFFCCHIPRGRWCSDECRRTAHNRSYLEYRAANLEKETARMVRHRAEWDEAHRLKNQSRNLIRKAKIAGVDSEPVDALVVYERDRWTCQLCGEHIDSTLRYPDRMSASVDHIIPLSHGGPHNYANVQAAHLTCNASKGNRVPRPSRATLNPDKGGNDVWQGLCTERASQPLSR